MCKFATKLFPFLVFLLGFNNMLWADEQRLTILHTDDLHSHFLGFSPNLDYTPLTTGDDETIGGWARIASVINATKENRDNPVLVLDAGDFLMGSLFHLVSREEALELTIMKEMGVDVTTIGNHEFDFRPEGLANIIAAATSKSGMPTLVSSNMIFSDEDDRDDLLEEQYEAGLVKPYVVIESGGLKAGIFGLMGTDAAEVAPFAKPLTFGDPAEYARTIVAKLRKEENVDVVICLSHSGLDDDPSKSEDLILAKEVDGIDVIISGHTDTLLSKPIVENGTVIVHALGYGKWVGVLDLEVTSTGVSVVNYDYVAIDDTIVGDERIDNLVNEAIETTNQLALRPLGLEFDQVVAETEYDLVLEESESNLGNLVTDAILWAANQAEFDPADPESRVEIALQSNGVIRDNIIAGKTGMITVNDLFRVVPLGIGSGGSPAYPLVSLYVTGAELKKLFEVLTTLPAMKGADYFLQMSGAKLTYNPNRMLFDRVTGIQLDDGNGGFVQVDMSESNSETYKVVSNVYNATFLKVIGSYTMGILTIVPKDKSGNPIEDLMLARIDGNPDTPGVQEIKDWTALIDYVQSFADVNGNGIPDIPDRYASPDGRQTIDASFNPMKLLSGGNYLTWIAAALLVAALLLAVLIIYVPVRIIQKRKARP